MLADFKSELEALFDSAEMRQIQVDRFGRALTSVLDDMDRVFKTHYAAWQIAWAMDLKTQQGRFPKDSSIRQVREEIRKSEVPVRKEHLMRFINWYESESRSPYAIGVKGDWDYNTKTWRHEVMADFVGPDREEVLHFTWLVSHTAANKDGAYQADAFERRATIAFGKGSVHGHVLDFSQD